MVKRSKAEGRDEYARLKRSLVQHILEKRIYKAGELARLYDQTVKGNPTLEPARLKTMWDEIMSELNA